ncbi:type IV toxin-antitoxin system AbiEi family antitoxin domain-containing protein [Hymenobacter daeguensis]
MSRSRTSPTQQRLLRRLQQLTPGQIVRFADFEQLGLSAPAVASALNRLTRTGQVQRVAKGRYRVAPTGRFGPVPPSEQQVLESLLQPAATGGLEYPTGAAIFNRLGLTTQVPREIEIATPRPKPAKQIGTVRVRYVRNAGATRPEEVELRQLLDALRRIKRVPDARPAKLIIQLREKVRRLPAADKRRLATLALSYNPATRALLGALLEDIGEKALIPALRASLNPLTVYRLGLSAADLPNRDLWRIQ